jgi:lipopolysaccharide transport system ATP-binding protein
VEGVGKNYRLYDKPHHRLLQMLRGEKKTYYRDFWAVKDVSFSVRKGETVGIIGCNGSGKSTLLQMICGTLSPTTGSITTHGRIAALLELGSGFNPEFTGRENVYLNASVLGLSGGEIDARFDEIASFADIGDFLEQPIKTYSSGMAVRLAFAVAINVAPEILIVDEALAVGDAAFQRKCIRKIGELSDVGVSLLFVSHDMEAVKTMCSRALYLVRGSAIEFGSAKQVCISYERDLFGASKSAETSQTDDETKSSELELALVDQELLHTDEKTYGDGRAEIVDVVIKNQYQQQTNILTPQATYILSYRVIFKGSVDRPVFGMMITNREGICIFGTNTQKHHISRHQFDEGDEVSIEFHITNYLGPGIFYLTCGIHSSDHSDGVIYLQRRIDVLIFKVGVEEGLTIGGMANLNPKIEAKKLIL